MVLRRGLETLLNSGPIKKWANLGKVFEVYNCYSFSTGVAARVPRIGIAPHRFS